LSLTNPGFEMGDRTGWEWHGEGWEATDDSSLVSHGRFAIVNTIEPDATNEWRVLVQAMPSAPNRSYIAQLWIAATNAPGVECYLEIQFLDDQWRVLAQHQSQHLFGDFPYTMVTIPKMQAPSRTAMIGLRGAVYVPSKPRKVPAVVAMDDFELLEVP